MTAKTPFTRNCALELLKTGQVRQFNTEHQIYKHENSHSRLDLSDADLSDADLHNADLHNAYLRNANLRNADLRNADLGDVDFTNAHGVVWISYDRIQSQDTPVHWDEWPLVLVDHGLLGIIACCGCREMTPELLFAHWKNYEHADPEKYAHRNTVMLPLLVDAIRQAATKNWPAANCILENLKARWGAASPHAFEPIAPARPPAATPSAPAPAAPGP